MSRNRTSQGDNRRFNNAPMSTPQPLDQITLRHPALAEDLRLILRMTRYWNIFVRVLQAIVMLCFPVFACWALGVFGTSVDPSQSPSVEVSRLPTCKEVLTTRTTADQLVSVENVLYAEAAAWLAQLENRTFNSQQDKALLLMLPWLDPCDVHDTMHEASDITLERCVVEQIRLFEEASQYELFSNIIAGALASASRHADHYQNEAEMPPDVSNTLNGTPNPVWSQAPAFHQRVLAARSERFSAALVETQQRIDALGLGSSIASRRSLLARWESTCARLRAESMITEEISRRGECL